MRVRKQVMAGSGRLAADLRCLILTAAAGLLLAGEVFAGTQSQSGRGDSSCRNFVDGTDVPDSFIPQVEEVRITIPGLEETRTLVWVSDMHIVSGAEDPDVTKENREKVQERCEMMKSPSGLTSDRTWELLSAQIDSFGADYVIFGADMLDYASEENLEKLEAGLDRIRTPWMYIRADHDYGRWYSDMGIKRMRKLHRRIAPQNRLWTERFPGFIVAGLDNTTTAVSEETLEEFRALCGEGKPIILCSHVPFDTGMEDSDSLDELSRELWGDRVLCWGDGDEYDISKGECMKQLMEIITAKDSPVCAILAGHLHASWEGKVTRGCMEHVFSAAFSDNVGLITVSGE